MYYIKMTKIFQEFPGKKLFANLTKFFVVDLTFFHHVSRLIKIYQNSLIKK